MELRKSTRTRSKMKLGLQGPSGSGKTYSALLLAHGLTNDWSKVAVIDTENGSADLYADLGNYQVLQLTKPFTPERYVQALETCEKQGMEVIIIDSVSHEWEGSGGILETHGNMPGNSFANWSKVTPRHNALIQKILQCSSHVVATIRSKQDYVLNDKNGKMVPEKVGLKGVTREGFDYELTIVFDIGMTHQAICSKDRTGMFMDKPPIVISENTGKRILKWCDNGVELEKIKQMMKEAQDMKSLSEIYCKYPDYRNELQSEYELNKNSVIFLEGLHASDKI